MTCPHCGSLVHTQEASGILHWQCPCGGYGTAPIGPAPDDTAIEMRREARQGPDPLVSPDGPRAFGGGFG